MLLFDLFTFISNSKDEKTPSELLQDGTWKIKVIKFQGTVVPDACNLDNTWKFGATTVFQDYGALKCDPSDINETLPYTLTADGKKLTIGGDELVVNELTESKLLVTDTFLEASIEFFK